MERVSTSRRILGLFFELLTAERPRTKARLRVLPGYHDLSESAFESAFQRDKTALRQAGVIIDMVHEPVEAYRVSAASFVSTPVPLDETDMSLIHMAIQAWRTGGPDVGMVVPKLAALSEEGPLTPAARVSLGLEGAESLATLVEAIAHRRIVSFAYTSASGTFTRAVEPWRLVLRGRALYLWGRDLDREHERLFRLSRLRSEVELLGESGDAGPVPDLEVDPFERLLVAPTLAVRFTSNLRISACVEAEEEGVTDGEWRIVHGERDEWGTWISRILAEAEDVVVIEPLDLRTQIRTRLEAAARWGSDDA